MCILTFIPAGINIDSECEESLDNGGQHNPDGHGWAIAIPNGGILMGKSLDIDEALTQFISVRDLHPNGPALFHSRWATHGSIRLGNCHPFNVGHSPLTVMAHNGILPNSSHPAAGDDRSDTALFADEILPRQYKRLDKPGAFRALTNYCGRGNKLVILTVDPRYRHNSYIVNESSGQWDTGTGMWHSNSDYLYAPYLGSVVSAAAVNDAECDWKRELVINGSDDPTECDLCLQRVNYLGICTGCGTCQDCYEYERDCMCYFGSEVKLRM